MAFKPAERRNSKLRLALTGPSGAGKTFTMLLILCALATRRAVMDSERGAASKYAIKNGTAEGPGNWKFDVEELDAKDPGAYMKKIGEAAELGYPVLGVDSYSHSWLGALELIDRLGGWVKGGKSVSPLVAKLVDTILSYPGHVVVTMRSKAEHVIETNEKTGKAGMKKIGMAAVAREGTEYEFDVILDMSTDGTIAVTKTRCPALADGVFVRTDVPRIVEILKSWLDEGAPLSPRAEAVERIKFASDAVALEAAGKFINDQKLTGKLTPEDLEEIKALYIAKKTALADDVVPE